MSRISVYRSIFDYVMMTGMILAMGACEEPINVEYFDPEPEIVVEGLITDQPGPYEIKMSYTGAYTNYSDGNNPPVTGAMITIFDDAGNAELLQEISAGFYQTNPFGIMGVVRRSYTVNILTADGREIESYPEILLEVPEVDSIYYFFKPLSPTNRQGHQVRILTQDPPGDYNYYRWKWEGYYLFYLVSEMEAIGCFKHEFDINRINVLSGEDLDGNVFDHPITLIEHFSNDRYLIYVFQQSLTEGAYKFWNSIYEQGNNVGSIFDPQPSKIQGNLYYTDGTDEQVHGYFGASAIKTKYQLMNFNTNIRPLYPREYPFKPSCSAYPNSATYDPSYSDSWPEGWE